MSGILVFIGFMTACAAAAATGVMFKPGMWYEGLKKPSWTPPNWLFPIAWTTLYIFMAIAAWRLVFSDHVMAPIAISFWAAQIALNTLWTPTFFGLRRPKVAFRVICALWVMVALTMVTSFAVDALAGWLLVPYIIWVSYAAALNRYIANNNPTQI